MHRKHHASFVFVPLLCATATATAQKHAALTPDQGTFAVEHALSLEAPKGSKQVRIWFPLPRDEEMQKVANLKVEAPAGWKETVDAEGNRYVYVETAPPADGKVKVATSFQVTRKEQNVDVDAKKTRPLTDAEKKEHAANLDSDKHVVVDAGIKKLAAEITGGETNPVLAARKLYDWTLANVEYWVKDPSKWKASPVGSSEYCLKERTGNCTDFHSLWTALARGAGIPTRLKYGSIFKPSLDGVDKDASYHCWPEFWAPGIGWIPHDVAVADIYVAPAIALDANNKDKVTLTTAAGYDGPSEAWVDYYFGNLDARRVTWTLGRDLELRPKQAAGPVNAVAKGYVEIDGAEFTKWDRKMTFREVKNEKPKQ